MNISLIFFALPIATIILAVVFQKLIGCPILIAAATFAIYLIVTYAAFDSNFLIAAIVYTVLAFLSALFVKLITDSGDCNSTQTQINNEDTYMTNNDINVANNNRYSCGCRRR